MKAKLALAAGIAAGIALFFYAMRGVDFTRLSEVWSQADHLFLSLVILTNIAETFMRGVKWKILLDPAGEVRVWDSFRMEAAGLALNNILPFRLGEIVRGTAGAGLFKMPAATVFATIVVERALDVVALVLLLAIIGSAGSIESDIFRHKTAMCLLFVAVAMGICAIVYAERILKIKALSPLFDKFPSLAKIFSQIASGALAFRSWKRGGLVIIAAMFQWFVNSLSPLAAVYAFHLQDKMDASHCLIVTVASAIACSIPAMPGFFGNYEAGVAAVMGAWGIEKDTAFALAFSAHIIGYITITAMGLLFVYGLGYSIGKVWKMGKH